MGSHISTAFCSCHEFRCWVWCKHHLSTKTIRFLHAHPPARRHKSSARTWLLSAKSMATYMKEGLCCEKWKCSSRRTRPVPVPYLPDLPPATPTAELPAEDTRCPDSVKFSSRVGWIRQYGSSCASPMLYWKSFTRFDGSAHCSSRGTASQLSNILPWVAYPGFSQPYASLSPVYHPRKRCYSIFVCITQSP